MSSGIIELNEV